MFNRMALKTRCGALRPGALQLGGAQTGYGNEDESYKSRRQKKLTSQLVCDQSYFDCVKLEATFPSGFVVANETQRNI